MFKNIHVSKALQRSLWNLLVIFISLIIVFTTILPIIMGGYSKVFYTIDPDIMYVSNALLYIKNGSITFDGHPGTPAIMFLAFALTPLRLFAKFVVSTNFTDWVFSNYPFVIMYLRIWQAVLLFGSLLVISFAMFKFVKKNSPIFSVFFGLLIFGPFYYAGSSISAESFSFFAVSIWLLILVYHFLKEDLVSLFLLTLAAGFAFAVRATNLFLLPATLIAVLYYKSSFKYKLILILLSLLSIGAGFVSGIYPIQRGPIFVLKSVFNLANTTEIHGGGEHIFFSLQVYINSAATYFVNNSSATLAFLLFSAVSLISFIYEKEKKLKKVALIALIFSVGGLIFAKYPLAHYETGNYLVVIFIGSALLYKLNNKANLVFIILCILFVAPVFKSYYAQISLLQEQSFYLEKFVRNNPARVAEVWDWGRSREFSYLWTRDYSSGIFDDQLSASSPKIYQLVSFEDIRVSATKDTNISQVCWDELYIQNVSLESFVENNPEYKNSAERIPGTDMSLIRSEKCSL